MEIRLVYDDFNKILKVLQLFLLPRKLRNW